MTKHTIKSKIEPVKNDYKEVLGINASNWIKSNYQISNGAIISDESIEEEMALIEDDLGEDSE